jgi:hypothetical protein
MHPLDIAYLMGHASPRTTMIYNNPRREEIVRQMSAANPSKIVEKSVERPRSVARKLLILLFF